MEKAVPSLLDLRKRARAVALSCLQCGHKAVIDIDDLIERFGPQFHFTGIREKSRCGKCQGREVHIAPIWPDPQLERARALKEDD